jgi:hypothetical protein
MANVLTESGMAFEEASWNDIVPATADMKAEYISSDGFSGAEF